MDVPVFCSIIESKSENGTSSLLARIRPTVDLPDPINPHRKIRVYFFMISDQISSV
jgi:hypothetical protein